MPAPRKFTDDVERRICADYLSGVSWHDLAARYQSNTRSIRRILDRHHVRRIRRDADTFQRRLDKLAGDEVRKLKVENVRLRSAVKSLSAENAQLRADRDEAVRVAAELRWVQEHLDTRAASKV